MQRILRLTLMLVMILFSTQLFADNADTLSADAAPLLNTEKIAKTENTPVQTQAEPQKECVSYPGGQACGYNCVKAPGKAMCAKTPDQYCIVGDLGEMACGYGCIRTGTGKVQCAQQADQSCVSSNYGETACGFDCKRTIHQARCAHYPQDNCVVSQFGEIKCGVRCRLEGLRSICEVQR